MRPQVMKQVTNWSVKRSGPAMTVTGWYCDRHIIITGVARLETMAGKVIATDMGNESYELVVGRLGSAPLVIELGEAELPSSL